jgi:pimeloyl-ACP methyl ester carboxylesterase
VRGLGRAVAGGMVDSGHAVLYLRQLMRGNRIAPVTSAPAEPRGKDALPVLMLHGYMATRGAVRLLERRLVERGHVVVTYRLGPVHLGDIRRSAGLIARKIESLAGQTGVGRVDIVAHSMGGLVALDYVKRLGGWRRVRRLILLGTPIQGTWSALLGMITAPLGRASVQLLPGSRFLRELAAEPLPPGPEVVTIAGERDWLAPQASTVLPGVRHVLLPTSHSGLLVDEQAAEVVANILSQPRSPEACAEADKEADKEQEPGASENHGTVDGASRAI